MTATVSLLGVRAQVNLPADTDPPLLWLIGPPAMTIHINLTFVDPGAAALDSRDANPTIATLGLAEFEQSLDAAAADPSSLGPANVDGVHGPWVLFYTARDAAGNASPSVTRSLYIDTRCPTGATWCAGTRTCGVAVCLPESAAIVLGLSRNMAAAAEYVPPVDTQAPLLRLAELPGDQSAPNETLPAGVSSIVFSRWQIGQEERGFVDPGWEAEDSVDGDLSALVSRRGLQQVQAAALAGVPTAQDVPLTIEYMVADAAGNLAVAVRAVWLVCSENEVPCETMAGEHVCTVAGICIVHAQAQDVGAVSAESAELKLIGPAVVYVAQGTPYVRCGGRQPLDILCDEVCSCHTILQHNSTSHTFMSKFGNNRQWHACR